MMIKVIKNCSHVFKQAVVAYLFSNALANIDLCFQVQYKKGWIVGMQDFMHFLHQGNLNHPNSFHSQENA